MEFGVLFTSHPNPKEEPYPHRDVHARTTEEILEAERLGYDTAWIADRAGARRAGRARLRQCVARAARR
jgi:alkanesulfonate monooxygenase SsuD/methylene tetrahydromethanopterin reductase-like flavin-dependent oxidoreductase (luciferase family)